MPENTPQSVGASGGDAKSFVAPAGEFETFVASALSTILQIDVAGVGADDALVDLGGDSFVAAQLGTWIWGRFRVEVFPATILEEVTIRGIAKAVANARMLAQTARSASPGERS